MAIKIIAGPSEEGLPYSRAVRAGDFIYVSGMVAFDDDFNIVPGGTAAETTKILEDLKVLLGEAGCSLRDVVKVNICLPHPENFDEFNKVYARYFDVDPPARATICAALTIDVKVELEAIVYAPETK